MKIMRHKTKVIKIGNLHIGGNDPIAIQSMAKTKTSDIRGVAGQIKILESAGCDIVRLAVKDIADARAFKQIKKQAGIPLVADIHFDWRLAIEAIENGADKIRLNPGNIYKQDQVRKVVSALKMHRIPLRIGVNSGSVIMGDRSWVLGLGKGLTPKTYNLKPNMSDLLVQSAIGYIRIIEKLGFYNIVVSLKASNVLDTVEAYRKISKVCDYPLHLGVTATGFPGQGIVKSSLAIGALLMEGIGDTIRVSLTDTPEEEVRAAKFILEGLGMRSFGPEIISCPTCGRCEVDLVTIVKEFEDKISSVNSQLSTVNSQPVRVAIMGCVVNGPGEAKEADVGIAFGKKEGLLFKHGKPIKKISADKCVDTLIKSLQ